MEHRIEFIDVEVQQSSSQDIVKLNDWHVPWHDIYAIEVAFAFCEAIQPSIIILDEVHDFYALSRFDKDPRRKNRLQEEIDTCTVYLKELRLRCPNSRMILMGSNHLDRLRKFLWRKAEELADLRALQLEELLCLKEIGIEFMDVYVHRPSEDPKSSFLFKHGDLVRKFGGYTAKAELENEGTSGMSGHSHRLGVHYSTKRGGEYTWVEAGCLCQRDAEYIDGVSNWQHGLGLLQVRNGHFLALPIPIINYELVWGDLVIKASHRKDGDLWVQE